MLTNGSRLSQGHPLPELQSAPRHDVAAREFHALDRPERERQEHGNFSIPQRPPPPATSAVAANRIGRCERRARMLLLRCNGVPHTKVLLSPHAGRLVVLLDRKSVRLGW
jgi:hypothetical protein